MIKGISFKVERSNNVAFKDLLEIVNAERYSWIINDSDIYSTATLENILVKGIYSGFDLLEQLTQEHFVIFANFMAFHSKKEIDKFFSYDKFLESKCEIAVFVVDCNVYSIFVKNEQFIDKIKQYISKVSGMDVKEITEENASGYFGL